MHSRKRLVLRSPSPLRTLDTNLLPTPNRSHVYAASLRHKAAPMRSLQLRKISPVCHLASLALDGQLPEPKTPRKSPARLKTIYTFPRSRLFRLACIEPCLRLSRLSPLPRPETYKHNCIAADLLTTPLADQDDEDRCEVQVTASEASVHLRVTVNRTVD